MRVSSPRRANSSRQRRQIGAYGLSWISHPERYGICGSRSVVRPAQSQQNEIVAGQNRIDDLGYDGVFITHDAGKNGCVTVRAQARREVFAHFIFDAPAPQTLFGKGTAAKFSQRARKTHENPRGQILCPIIRAPAIAGVCGPGAFLFRIQRAWPLPPAFCRARAAVRTLGRTVSRYLLSAEMR
jgi:hypothetical protein